MKNLLLEILVTSAVTGFVIWRWSMLLPRVMRAVQPVASAVWERRREIEELQERGVEVR
jgi:DNA repair photolyase